MSNHPKTLFAKIVETIDQHRAERILSLAPVPSPAKNKIQRSKLFRWMLPNGGTILLVLLLIVTQSVWAKGSLATSGTSTNTISYQGRLADTSGNPITELTNMEFRLYNVPVGGVPLWTENWTGGNAVQVSDGLFNVMLGSIDTTLTTVVQGETQLYLGITIDTDSEMLPRVQLGSVPFSMQALTVPDGSITSNKISDGSVSTVDLADSSITSNKINNGSVGTVDLANGSVTPGKLDRSYVNRVGDTMSGSLSLGTNALTAGNVYGNGTTNRAQLHMPGWGADEGNLYINWHTGRNLVYGGGIGATKFQVDTDGNSWTSGNTWAGGTKSAVVATGQYGTRLLYAVESPEVRFTDEGLAQLQNGTATVNLDPIFIATIEKPFLIQVTPYGEDSLYIDEIGDDYFVVNASNRESNVEFTWRLSAYRQGYSEVRLESVDLDALTP